MSHATLSEYESGETRIDADLLPRIAEALGVSPCEFFLERAPAMPEPAVEAAIKQTAREAAEQAVAAVLERERATLREELRAALGETLDEERAMWEMYLGRLEARRAEEEAGRGEAEKAG